MTKQYPLSLPLPLAFPLPLAKIQFFPYAKDPVERLWR